MLGDIRYLIAGESVSTFQRGLDTGVLLAAEIVRRGISLDYLDLSRTDWRQSTFEYLAQLRVSRVDSVDPLSSSPFALAKTRIENVEAYSVILQRKDPPVDENYIGHAKHFAAAPSRIIQMNNPELTWRYSEHLLPQEYPEFAVPTTHCRSFEEFLDTIRSQQGESVAKPLHFFSGVGIEFFPADAKQVDLETYWNRWQPSVIVQPYLEEVTKSGDLRILVMNSRMVGWVLRKPQPGSRLANLHQGGTAHSFEPTPQQFAGARHVAKHLCPKGLYLLGLDFIGDFLTEVNITCPSAVPQINQTMGIKGESIIIDELEKLRLAGLVPSAPSELLQDRFSPTL